MHPKDVQVARLQKNLLTLADCASALSHRHPDSVAGANAVKKPVKKQGAGGGSKRRKPRAAVVAWDLSHNPVGRAYVLCKLLEPDYDVDLVGPIWTRYGHDLWSPLQDAGLNVRSFRCANLDEFVPKANLLAAIVKYDVVYVCKPRLPAVYLGTLIKQSSDCSMILDVDDFELSFFKDETTADLDEISAHADAALNEPFEELGTRYCQSLIPEFDALTVSNIALREKFGGHIVRHARDESQFNICEETRQQARAQLGIGEDEFALIFIGTPRPHKGVFEVAAALDEINDTSLVFHIIGGISDSRIKAKFDEYPNARVVLHGDCPFEDLPKLLSAADLVPLIQNPEHPISHYQIPAKISDATALGIPVLATETPPIRDLAAQGGVEVVEHTGLVERIRELRQRGQADRQSIRTFFLNELGCRVNRVRLANAIEQASEVQEPISEKLTAMMRLIEQTYKQRRQHNIRQLEALSQASADSEAVEPAGQGDARVPVQLDNAGNDHQNALTDKVTPLFRTVANRAINILPTHLVGRKKGYDIVYFWKQNDSGIYGRRSDMVLRYLSRSDRVGRILQLDAPMSAHDIEQNFRFPLGERNSQADRVLFNVYDRQIGARDTLSTRFRNQLVSKNNFAGQVAGNRLGKAQDYVHYVKEQMHQAGMKPERTIAWFCPVVWDAPKLVAELGFQGVVADLIDDQRGWNASPEFLDRLERNYADTLKVSDLVFANCQPLADAFQQYAPPIHIVPNGAERFSEMPEREVPEVLANLPGPIIGYVGNLRDRIDWMLLNEVVQSLPEASFVFAGPYSDSPNARQLAEYPNVHMIGVVPYEDVLSYLRAFDVGIVPHVRNRLTERMNPLKIYNYFAAGLPIVSSDVNNIENLGDYLEVAGSSEEFVAALRRAATRTIDTNATGWQQAMDGIAWDSRIENLLELMDGTFRRRFKLSA